MRPTRKTTLTLFVAGVVLFAMSGVGQPEGYLKSAPSWIGDVGWFGWLICALLLIVSGVYWVVLRMRHSDQPLAR
jgi:hypothetical protein